MSDYMTEYKRWLDFGDNDERLELKGLTEDQIKERFYTDLEFGTAGMRGIIRAGTNGMNYRTVSRATLGLAEYIKSCGPEAASRGVVISFDSRLKSAEFASLTARVLAQAGVKAILYDALRPVPLLSFGVRYFKAFAGVMITASHNPKEYNGYKVYGEDGAQLAPEAAAEVLKEINKLDYFSIPCADMEQALSQGMIVLAGKEVDDAYLAAILPLADMEIINKQSDKLKLIYTPLHGSGLSSVKNMFNALGFKNIELVPEQCIPDGSFPTVITPNPENAEALQMGIKLAKETGAELVIGTDPDCDRMGAAVKNEKGEFIPLTGNQLGCLMLEYRLRSLKNRGLLPKNGAVIKTIVSTELARAIAQSYNVELVEVLTGFKFIGEKIKEYEATNEHTFIFGFEESFGYLEGTHARDKDAVVACMLLSETACDYASQGMNLLEGLECIYKNYGYYSERTLSFTFEGIQGMQQIKDIMSKLTQAPPEHMGGLKVLALRDYDRSVRIIGDRKEKLTLPKSNVLYCELEQNCWFCARPSGTEPKLKLYIGARGSDRENCQNIMEMLLKDAQALIN